MSKMFAVIGAGFGDEGKGTTTAWLAKKHSANLIARNNGGAQAGHTVINNGVRHVFSSFGAGTLCDLDEPKTKTMTYLGKNFILNTAMFSKEHDELQAKLNKELAPVYIHQQAKVTTIFDVAINRIAESIRRKKHGSVGLGINETVTRSEHPDFTITADMVCGGQRTRLVSVLNNIQHNRIKDRVEKSIALEFEIYENASDDVRAIYDSILSGNVCCETLADKMIQEMSHDCVHLYTGNNLLFASNANGVAIYEGAQGLALDETLGDYPHVTRSKTGLISAVLAAYDLGIKTIQPVYVTRCYATRHGEGYLHREGEKISNEENIVDLTNVPNQFQGTMRFAPLNVSNLNYYIVKDIQRAEAVAEHLGVEILDRQMVITCLDQVGDTHMSLPTGDRLVKKEQIVDVVSTWTRSKVIAVGHGPQISDIKEV